VQRARLVERVLKSRIMGSSIPQQPREMMGNRVHQFPHRLGVRAAGWSEQEAQDG
jgi:hypothetical protein